MENPIKMDDLGIPVFLETPKSKRNNTGIFSSFANVEVKLPEEWPCQPETSMMLAFGRFASLAC